MTIATRLLGVLITVAIVGCTANPTLQTGPDAEVTFDGLTIRLYIDGVLESSLDAPALQIGVNDLDLSLGAQDNGAKPLQGALDQVHLFDVALTDSELLELIDSTP